MHVFRKPTPEAWMNFMTEVERHLGRPPFRVEGGPDELLEVFQGSIQACGEGASPQAFANVLKEKLK